MKSRIDLFRGPFKCYDKNTCYILKYLNIASNYFVEIYITNITNLTELKFQVL